MNLTYLIFKIQPNQPPLIIPDQRNNTHISFVCMASDASTAPLDVHLTAACMFMVVHTDRCQWKGGPNAWRKRGICDIIVAEKKIKIIIKDFGTNFVERIIVQSRLFSLPQVSTVRLNLISLFVTPLSHSQLRLIISIFKPFPEILLYVISFICKLVC